MIIGGYGYVNTSPSPVDDVESIKISNAYFNWLYATNEPVDEDTHVRYQEVYDDFVDPPYGEKDDPEAPATWGTYTMLSAHYHNKCDASGGNDFVSHTSEVLLRRRESEDDPWLTIAIRPVDEASDFLIDYYDRFCQAGHDYQYIVVPVVNGEEAEYLTGNMSEFVHTQFDGIYLSDINENWGTGFNVKYTRERNRQSSVVTTLGSKYPTVVSNGMIDYYSGTVTGFFVDYSIDTKEMDLEGNVAYRDAFIDFLQNYNPKILRTYDGIMAMVQIDGNIQEDAQDTYLVTNITLNWVEIGDATDYDALLANGFLISL